MKNKKGFTLIELLAVIVVLAIVALITVPTVLGVIEKTKKSALKDSAYGLIEAANLYYAQYGVPETARFDIENGVQNTEEENELSYKGNIKNGTVLINNKGKIMVCVNEDGYSAYKNYSQNEVIAVNKETCYIPENNSMVYLEQSGKTLDELTNQELTEEIENLKNEIALIKENKTDTTTTSNLQGELTSLSSVLGNHTSTIDNINNKIGNTDISGIGSDITSAISNLNNIKANKSNSLSGYGITDISSKFLYESNIHTVTTESWFGDLYRYQFTKQSDWIPIAIFNGYRPAASQYQIVAWSLSDNNVVDVYFQYPASDVRMSITVLYYKP